MQTNVSVRPLGAGTILLALLGSTPGEVRATSSGPQAGVSGVPAGVGLAAEMTCAACHASLPLNPDRDGRVELHGVPDRYVPGARYRLTFSIAHPAPDLRRWGFQLTAVATRSLLGAGAWKATDPARTQVVRGAVAGRSYVEHTHAGTAIGSSGGHSWSFEWISPEADVGAVAFYGGGVASNLDGSMEGDRVFNPTPEPLAIVEGPASPSPTREGKP